MKVGFGDKRRIAATSGFKDKASLALMHGASFLLCSLISLAEGAEAIGIGFLAGVSQRYFPAAFLGFVIRAVIEGDIYKNSAYTAAAGVIAAARWISASSGSKAAPKSAIIGGSLSLIFTKASSLLMLGNAGFAGFVSIIFDVLLFISFSKTLPALFSMQNNKTSKAKCATAFSLLCMVFAACKTSILYFSAGRIAASLLCAFAGYELADDIFGAAIFASTAGIILSEPAFSFAAAGIGSAAILCRSIVFKERWTRSLFFTVVSSAFSLVGTNHTFSALFLCENLIACFLYSILPSPSPESKLKSADLPHSVEPEITAKLEDIAKALSSVSDSFLKVKNDRGSALTIDSVYQKAAERICKHCPMAGYCWVRSYDTTAEALSKLNSVLINNGHISKGDIGTPLKTRCIALSELSDAINAEYFSLLSDRRERYAKTRFLTAASKQYELISAVLRDIVRQHKIPKEQLQRQEKPRYYLDYSAINLSREKECGDAVKFFTAENGCSYIILSDGMGTGASAASEAALCCKLAEKLLKSGFSESVTAEMINHLTSFCNEDESATAIDLLSFDRFSGDTLFTKAGAASSFVMTEGSVKRVSAQSLPVGIMGEPSFSIKKITLKPGDIVLMLSDGAADTAAKLCHILATQSSLSCREMCRKAKQLYSGTDIRDDITVLFAKVAEKSQ